MPVVASTVSAYAAAARSATTSMWNAIESAFGWTWTTETSVPSSLAYSLNASSRGSFASMNSARPGTLAFSSSNFPGLSRLVAMKMNGPDMPLLRRSGRALEAGPEKPKARDLPGPSE